MELDIIKSDKETCQGLVFRCSVNKYISNTGAYVEKFSMSPLKRKSCGGCEDCGWLDVSLSDLCDFEKIIMPDDPEDKALYTIGIINQNTDWETGIVDDYDLEFIKI